MKKTRWLTMAALLLAFALVLGGCGNDEQTTTEEPTTTEEQTTEEAMTAQELLDASQTAMQSVTAVSANMSLNMKMTYAQDGVSGETEVGLDMDLKVTQEPKAMYAGGSMSMMGITFDMEIYTEVVDGQSVTYTKMFDEWSKETAEDSGDTSLELEQIVNLENLDGFEMTLAETTETFEGKEVYVITTTLTGDSLAAMMESSSEMMGDTMGAYDYSKMTADTKVLIYKDDNRVAQVSMDLTGVEDVIATDDSGLEDVKFENYNVTITFYAYDNIGAIVVPEEAKNATQEDTSLLDPDTSIGLVQDDQGNYILSAYFEEDDLTALIPQPEGLLIDEYYSESSLLYFDLVQGNADKELYVCYTSYILDEDFGESTISTSHQEAVKAMMNDKSYTNVVATGVRTAEAGDYTVKYTCLSYTYAESISCKEYNSWIIVDGNKLLFCEVYETAYSGSCDLIADEKAMMAALFSGVKFQ